jgi:hypothetical protein
MAHDASPSWSGFNYQGKIALFYALQCINSEYANDPQFDFDNHHLILERNEDFEIEINTSLISFHQVKAYQGSAFSKYKNALIELSLELEKNQHTTGYIHTWNSIDLPAGKTLQICVADEIDLVLSEYTNAPGSNATIIAKAAGTDNKLPKLAAIIRAALPGQTTVQIYNTLQDIKNNTNSTLSRLNCYQYSNGNTYCGLSEIDEFVRSELKAAFEHRKTSATALQIERAFYYFLGTIDEHIRKRHEQYSASQTLPIKFTDILAALSTDFENPSDEYFLHHFKYMLFKAFDEYEGDGNYVQPSLDDGAHCNLRAIRSRLASAHPRHLLSLYEAFAPHLPLDLTNTITAAISVDLENVQLYLLPIINKISTQKSDVQITSRRLTYKRINKPNEHYLPTLIGPGRTGAVLARKILENPNMIEILFEIRSLINTSGLNGKILELSKDRMSVAANETEVVRQKRTEIINNLRFIDADQAIQELNAD